MFDCTFFSHSFPSTQLSIHVILMNGRLVKKKKKDFLWLTLLVEFVFNLCYIPFPVLM